MKRFELFKVGTHNGIDFSAEDLKGVVTSYDPALHEAPITIGHPKDNLPAYGWIESISYNEETQTLEAVPHQLEEQFTELVTAGRFKKRSASFYPPDSPANPTPGKYHLRHVAFLGAQPPAVKGMKAVEFNEADDCVTIEFGEVDSWSIARFMRNMREFIVDKFDLEQADAVVPSWMVEDAEALAREPSLEPEAASFGEHDNPEHDMKLTPEQIQALQDENARLKEQNQTLEGEKADFAEEQKKVRREALVQKFNKLADEGRVLPMEAEKLADFAQALEESEISVDFGEGDAQGLQGHFLDMMTALPKQVNFGESSGGSQEPAEVTPKVLAAKISEVQLKAEAEGKTLNYAEALGIAKTELAADEK